MPTVKIGDNTGDDFSGTEDTHVREANATTNYATVNPIQVTKWTGGDHTHLIIAFSGISNLPGTLTVSSATLYLYQGDSSATYNVTAKKLARNWVIAEITWTIYSTGNSWTTGGALDEPNDRSATETFDISINGVNLEYKALSSAQLASDVEDFADGTLGNYGWHLERSDAGNDTTFKHFIPEDGTNAIRPYLSVTYTEVAAGNIVPIIDHHNRMMAMMGS